jgi:hypothetical protein
MMGAAVMMIGLLVGGGALFVEQAFASDPPSLTIQAQDIQSLGSSQIQVNIHHAASSSSYSVTIEVTVTPTAQVPVTPKAGGPFCETITVTTDAGGNGKATVYYPVDTANYPTTFAACTGSTGGPNTVLGGTYAVTATATLTGSTTVVLTCPPTGSATCTSFAVQSPENVVTGTANLSTVSTSTSDFLYLCPGVASGTTETTSNSVYEQTTVASATLTGIPGQPTVLSTNTPGQESVDAIINPCAAPASIITHAVFTFNNVTVSPPNANPSTGGLILTSETTGTVDAPMSTMTLASNGLLEPTTTQYTSLQSHVPIVGTDGLRRVSGIAEGQALVTAVSCAAGSIGYTFGTVTCTSIGMSISHGLSTTLWFELDNVPGK